MNIGQITSLLVLATASLAACSQEQAAPEAPNPLGETSVATINGEPVYQSVFEPLLNGASAEGRWRSD